MIAQQTISTLLLIIFLIFLYLNQGNPYEQ